MRRPLDVYLQVVCLLSSPLDGSWEAWPNRCVKLFTRQLFFALCLVRVPGESDSSVSSSSLQSLVVVVVVVVVVFVFFS